ncbi:MAG: secE [Alphaproteobacteria bacterium]|nr:secE [Alphaproteobacteria bacterium]
MAGFNPLQFFDEVKRETRKVVWPSATETRTATILVSIMIAISSLFLFTVDQVISWLLKLVLGV